MRIRFLIAAAVVSCAACSSESQTGGVRSPSMTPQCSPGADRSCSCASGSGTQTCNDASQWAACECDTTPSMNDFGNPDSITPVVDAGPIVPPSGDPGDCSPGLYLGTYSCDITLFGLLPVPLAGDVSFNLSINETTIDQECEDGQEFCADLVISENGGTLFGLAGFVGFETTLQGALDCRTGEFRAMGVDGRWGNAISTDPNNPDALWTVEDPPMGMFDGMLMGTHTKGADETIAGMWDLHERAMDINCAGPFTVTLQP